MDEESIDYFKSLSEEIGIPYPSLIAEMAEMGLAEMGQKWGQTPLASSAAE